MFKYILTAGLLLSGLGTAQMAQAANCAPRDRVVDRLETHYTEQLAAGGLQTSRSTTALVEVWASEETGTFTVILTTPQGLSCIVASGTDWFTQTAVEQAKDVPS